MNLKISGHHLEVTPALRAYVESKLERIKRHFDNVIDVTVTLSVDSLTEKEKRQRTPTMYYYVRPGPAGPGVQSSEARAARRGGYPRRRRRALVERSEDGPAAGRPEKAKQERGRGLPAVSAESQQRVGQGVFSE